MNAFFFSRFKQYCFRQFYIPVIPATLSEFCRTPCVTLTHTHYNYQKEDTPLHCWNWNGCCWIWITFAKIRRGNLYLLPCHPNNTRERSILHTPTYGVFTFLIWTSPFRHGVHFYSWKEDNCLAGIWSSALCLSKSRPPIPIENQNLGKRSHFEAAKEWSNYSASVAVMADVYASCHLSPNDPCTSMNQSLQAYGRSYTAWCNFTGVLVNFFLKPPIWYDCVGVQYIN